MEKTLPAFEELPRSADPSPEKVRFEEKTVEIEETDPDIERDSADQDVDKAQPKSLEVRSAVDTTDDVNMAAETFRAYVIGCFFTFLGAAISNITDLRDQPLIVDPGLVQLVSLPVGKLWARYMPNQVIGWGKWSFKLNPGQFTIKEHALIVIMANVGVGWPPYAAGLVIVQVTKFGIPILMSGLT